MPRKSCGVVFPGRANSIEVMRLTTPAMATTSAPPRCEVTTFVPNPIGVSPLTTPWSVRAPTQERQIDVQTLLAKQALLLRHQPRARAAPGEA